MKKSRIKISLLKNINLDNNICVKGWVRTKRQGKNVTFISLNDGSTINSLQVVLDMQKFKVELVEQINTGSSVEFSGNLIKSQGKIQNYELDATELVLLGESDARKYPIQPKKHSFEFFWNYSYRYRSCFYRLSCYHCRRN